MMDLNVTSLVLAFLWGAFLGLVYFGGLWLTLTHVLGKRCFRRWLAASFVCRLAAVLAGFWVVLPMDPVAFFCTLAGFFLVRMLLIRMLGRENGVPHHAAHA